MTERVFKLVVVLSHPEIGEAFTKESVGDTIEELYGNMPSDLRMYTDTEAEYGVSFSYYTGADYLHVERVTLYKHSQGQWRHAPEYLGRLYAYQQDDCSGGWVTTTYWEEEGEEGED